MRDSTDLTFRSAGAADANAIHDLLERSGLPTDDLGTARPEFVIAEHAGTIIGIGALERFGTAALLRSVAVEPQWRGFGVGRWLIAQLEQRARAAGIDELILLTLTARDFFARLGYGAKSRERVPAAVLASAEFRSLCPASAHCMAKTLAPA
jgi:amino-acid N-acetyltransferase